MFFLNLTLSLELPWPSLCPRRRGAAQVPVPVPPPAPVPDPRASASASASAAVWDSSSATPSASASANANAAPVRREDECPDCREVWVTVKGKGQRYHFKKECYNAVRPVQLRVARAKGLTPCNICAKGA